MNLFNLSSTNRETHALISTGGWVGTLPDGYTTMVDGKKFTVCKFDSGTQILVHELPDGGDIRIQRDGSISWYNDRDKQHREDGPAAIYASGAEMWVYDGKFHREDGPAVTRADGTLEWWFDGELHREDGPAVTLPDGSQQWWVDDARHREDGPAVVNADGTVEYWLHDEQVNKEDLP